MGGIIMTKSAYGLAHRLSLPLSQVGSFPFGARPFAAVKGSYPHVAAALGRSCYRVVNESRAELSTGMTMTGAISSDHLGFPIRMPFMLASRFVSPDTDVLETVSVRMAEIFSSLPLTRDQSDRRSLTVLKMLVHGMVTLLSRNRDPVVFDPLGFDREAFPSQNYHEISEAFLTGIEYGVKDVEPRHTRPPVIVLFPHTEESAFESFVEEMQRQKRG